jgi:hypothetical protein
MGSCLRLSSGVRLLDGLPVAGSEVRIAFAPLSLWRGAARFARVEPANRMAFEPQRGGRYLRLWSAVKQQPHAARAKTYDLHGVVVRERHGELAELVDDHSL